MLVRPNALQPVRKVPRHRVQPPLRGQHHAGLRRQPEADSESNLYGRLDSFPNHDQVYMAGAAAARVAWTAGLVAVGALSLTLL